MKRFLALMMSAFMLVSLVSCGKPKDNESDREKELVLPEATEKEEKEEKEDNNELVLDIKELEEVDEVTLKDAASALGFENEKLFHAVANAMEISPFEMTKEDIEKVHYIAIGPEEDMGYSVFVGYIDYVDMCFSEEGTTESIMSKLNDIVMMSEFEYNKETDSLSDLSNFENIEMFEIYDVEISDVSFIKNYPILALGYFKNNGITDVSSLADYNPDSLIELDLTGNTISDWSPLYHIKEKVTVFYGVADGMPMTITLEDMLNQQNGENNELGEFEIKDVAGANEESENDKSGEIGVMEFFDENGETVDFGSLFE